jgi:hypothetical protein
MNRFRILFLLAAVALAGCSEDQPGQADQPGSAAPSEQSVQANDFSPILLKEPLPDGFVFPFRYHVRDDRIFDLDKGGTERRIVIDALDGNVTVVRKAVDHMFEQQGFKPTKPTDYRKGQRVSYRHKDGRRVNVTSWSQTGRKPQAPGAQAVVYFGWPVEASGGQ